MTCPLQIYYGQKNFSIYQEITGYFYVVSAH